MSFEETHDKPGVIAPPPLLAAAVIVLGLLLDWILPAYLLVNVLSMTDRIVIGALLIVTGVALSVSAVGMFRAGRTNVEPWKPTLRLITKGIFRWLRNPMYVGGALLLSGLAIMLASDWMLAMTIIFTFIMHFGVVKREERYLEAKFGDAYRLYKLSVPRYGVPFW